MSCEQLFAAVKLLHIQNKSNSLLENIYIELERIQPLVKGNDLVLLRDVAVKTIVLFHNHEIPDNYIFQFQKLANLVEEKDDFCWGKLALWMMASCVLLAAYVFITAPLSLPIGVLAFAGLMISCTLGFFGKRLYDDASEEQATQTKIWSPLYGALHDKIQDKRTHKNILSYPLNVRAQQL
jgi:hypothetical protein